MPLDLDPRGALQALTNQQPVPKFDNKRYVAEVEIQGAKFTGSGSSEKRALWDLLLDIALRAQSVAIDR